jgi:hypothetical protein
VEGGSLQNGANWATVGPTYTLGGNRSESRSLMCSIFRCNLHERFLKPAACEAKPLLASGRGIRSEYAMAGPTYAERDLKYTAELSFHTADNVVGGNEQLKRGLQLRWPAMQIFCCALKEVSLSDMRICARAGPTQTEMRNGSKLKHSASTSSSFPFFSASRITSACRDKGLC